MDVIELFDNYIYEVEEKMGELFQFIEEDQIIQVSKTFSELRALLTRWEHDYLTKIRKVVQGET